MIKPTILASLLGLLLLANSVIAEEVVPRKIRQFNGQTYTVKWTTENVEIYQTNKPEVTEFSFLDRAQAKFDKIATDAAVNKVKSVTSEELIKPLSLVGSIFSYETDQYFNQEPSAHPSLYRNIQVVDLNDPERKVRLTEFFNEQSIYTQLMRQPEIIQSLKALGVTPKPKNLQELSAALKDQMPSCELGFYDDPLEHFAFHKITNKTVTVQIAVSYGAEACRGRLTTMNLILPVEDETVKTNILKAQHLKDGFLMQTTKFNEKITGFADKYPRD